MRYAVLLCCAILITAAMADERKDEYAVMVFSGTREIRSITIGPKTRIEFPMINGEPDWKHGILTGAVVDIDRNLGHYEVRHDNQK